MRCKSSLPLCVVSLEEIQVQIPLVPNHLQKGEKHMSTSLPLNPNPTNQPTNQSHAYKPLATQIKQLGNLTRAKATLQNLEATETLTSSVP